MKIKEMIMHIQISTIRDRKNELISVDAPYIFIKSCDAKIEELKKGKVKVKGVRKCKCMNLEIIDFQVKIGCKYLNKNKETDLYIFQTQEGVFYYDWCENRIGTKEILKNINIKL